MITPHHNRKQKVCKDIIAYPEEKTNKKHQIPPHKRKGSSRKKNHIRHISMWSHSAAPPLCVPGSPGKVLAFLPWAGALVCVWLHLFCWLSRQVSSPFCCPLNLLCDLLSCAVPSPLRVPAFSFSGFFFCTVLFPYAPLLSSAAVWSYAPLFLFF